MAKNLKLLMIIVTLTVMIQQSYGQYDNNYYPDNYYYVQNGASGQSAHYNQWISLFNSISYTKGVCSYGSIQIDDPIYINSVSANRNINISCSVGYSPYCNNYLIGGKIILQFGAPTGPMGTWRNINGLNFDTRGGTLNVSLANYITADELFKPMAFRIIKTLRDGTVTYGNYSEHLYFYDNITMSIPKEMVCEGNTIDILSSYTCPQIASADPYATIEAKIFGSWVKLSKSLTKNTSLTYSDIFGNYPDYYNKEFKIRAYKVIDYITRDTIFANGSRDGLRVVFLPKAKVEIEPKSPTCADSTNSEIKFRLPNAPENGFKDLDGNPLKLLITLERYESSQICNPSDIGCKIKWFENQYYYFNDGSTIHEEINGDNITIKNDPTNRLAPGVYRVSVHFDSRVANCSVDSFFRFKAPQPFTSSAQAEVLPGYPSYHVRTNQNSAQVKFTFGGGTEPYVIKLGNDTIRKLFKSDLDATNSYKMDVTTNMGDGVTNQTITYRIADKNNCTGSQTVPITFNRPPDISITNGTPSNIDCNTSDVGSHANGKVSWTLSGGAPPYSVKLFRDGHDLNISKTVNSENETVTFDGNQITMGDYSIQVSDNLNTTYNKPSTGVIRVDQPLALSLSASPVNNNCHGESKGSFILTQGGGNGNFSTTFTKAGESFDRDNGTLPEGSYTIIMTDAKNCRKTITNQQIGQPQFPFTLTATYSKPMSCPEVSNAEVTATVYNFQANNPTTNVSFWIGTNKLTVKSSSISGQNGTFVLSGLSQTSKDTIVVKDQYSDVENLVCKAQDTVAIPLKSLKFSITPSTSQSAPCTGKYGIVTITPNNGEGTSYTYKIDGATKPSNINPLKGNSVHSFSVTDGVGCTATYQNYKVITRSDSVKLANVVPSNITEAWCTSSNSGGLSVNTVTNGVGNIIYKCIGESQTFTGQSSGTFANLLPKLYTIQASDDSLCFDTKEVLVPVRNDSLNIIAVNSIHAACEGESYTGEIKVSRYTNNQKTGFGNITYTLGSKSQNDTIFKDRISGHYIINAVDEKNCPASASVDVEFDSNPVTLTIDSVFDQTCNQVANARIYLKAHTATVGTEQTFKFTYNGKTTDWNKDTVSYKLNTAGDYSFSVTDMNNCGTTLAHTIENLKHAPKPKLAFVDSTACANADNGKLTITNTPNSSLAKYRYTLGAQTKYASSSNEEITFPNLTKGYYIITAKDTLGCQDTARFYVGVETDSVKIKNITPQVATCIAAQNGSAKIVATSADPEKMTDKYTFLLNNGSVFKGDSVTFPNLAVNKTGNYTVQVTDRFGCRNSANFIIGVRSDTLNIFSRPSVNPSCQGYNDGLIAVRRKSGDEKFRYDLTSTGYNRSFYTTDTLVKVLSLPQGNYTLSVRDTNNCRAYIDNIVLTDPQQIQFTSVYNNYIKHKGQSEGLVEAKVWKGNNKYNYEWVNSDNGSVISTGKVTDIETIRFDKLHAGNYLLRVQDTAKCAVEPTGYLERRFTIAEPERDLMLTIRSLRNASCFGSSDGEFVLEASGGWGNQYKYGFDANVDHMDIINRFTGRKKESIIMFAADTSGVTVSIPVTVDEPAMLAASLSSKQDVTCYGEANGSATLNIAGGNYPHYFISSNNLNWEKGYTKHNLPVGRSTLYIRDTLNCATSTPVEVDLSGPAQIVETSQITRSLCGFNNGRIVSAISGGKAPYSYQWYQDNLLLPIQTNRADSLFSGSYRLVVTDDFACSREFTFPVSDITDLTIDNIITTPVTCWGYTDGKASIQISKGNPEYIITWPDNSGGYSVSGLKEGTYTVGVTDQEKCKVFRDFTIGTPVQIYLAENRIANPLCEGREDGSIDISAAGDFTGFDYTWSTGRKGNTIRSLAPGTYSVTVADDHNCSNTFNFDLQYQNFIKPSLGNDLTLCKGNSVQLKAGAFSVYNWGSTTGLKSSEPNITVSEPASYSVEVKDYAGCIGRDTINIAESATEMTGKLLIATYIAQHDTVMIFEASWPLPDSVKFELEGCKILQTGKYFREVIFADTGTYKIGLVSYLNDCSDQIEKVVVVEPRAASALKSAQNRMIKSFKASPNPNNGLFDVELLLRESAAARLRLINISTGITTDVREYKGSDLYTIHYNLNLTPGMYLLHIQVGSEAQTKTLVIQ